MAQGDRPVSEGGGDGFCAKGGRRGGSSAVPLALEGWSLLHQMFRIRWPEWNALAREVRRKAVDEAVSVLQAMENTANGRTGLTSLLGHKGDLMLVHFRDSMDALNEAELSLSQLKLAPVPGADHLLPLGGGTRALQRLRPSLPLPPGEGRRARHAGVERAGGGLPGPGAEDHGGAPPARHPRATLRLLLPHGQEAWRGQELVRRALRGAPADDGGPRLHRPALRRPSDPDHLRLHRLRRLGVGVDLFADDPVVFKKLVYEMRFDQAGALYGRFGPFYMGLQFRAEELGALLEGRTPDFGTPSPT